MNTGHPSRSRGFTLIELMVVISIIALLSSIILANTQNARASARDATRIQEIHQIDNAVQTYGLSVGHAPDLGGTCGANIALQSPTDVSGCTALSSAVSGPHVNAWQNFISDIKPYIPAASIADPCNSCSSNSGLPMGYTYVAPAALVYMCGQNNTCGQMTTDPISQYQLYAPLEQKSVITSNDAGLGTVYSPDATAPTRITITFTGPPYGTPSPWAYNAGVSVTGLNSSGQCTITDSLGLLIPVHLYAPSNFVRAGPFTPGSGNTDTITATCSNYGASYIQTGVVTGY